jgi:hypothetical protein
VPIRDSVYRPAFPHTAALPGGAKWENGRQGSEELSSCDFCLLKAAAKALFIIVVGACAGVALRT